MEPTPAAAPQNSMSLDTAQCPSCGFFTGPMLTCPRCGARTQKRIAVRAVRLFCIFGSVIGVFLLWYAAYLKTPEVLHVSDITELTINAMATIEGTVTAVRENTAKKPGSLTVSIDDGTGRINMLAYGKLEAMQAQQLIPSVGDKVAVTGNISTSERYGPTIMLAVPERLRIIEKVQPTRISALGSDDVGKGVLLRVRVAPDGYTTRETRYGPMHSFLLEDSSGELNVVMNDALFAKLPDATRRLLTESTKQFEVAVTVGEYRGELNGKISDISSIKPVSGGAAPARRPAPPADNEPAADEE